MLLLKLLLVASETYTDEEVFLILLHCAIVRVII